MFGRGADPAAVVRLACGPAGRAGRVGAHAWRFHPEPMGLLRRMATLASLLLAPLVAATTTTFGLAPRSDDGSQQQQQAPPQTPPQFAVACHPHLRQHCTNATTTNHAQCRDLLPVDANCTDALISRFRAENCAQYEPDGGLIDIAKFGGKGDGLADNTAAIRRAVNATRACGGSVKFPTGRYYVSETIELAHDDDWGGCACLPASLLPVAVPSVLLLAAGACSDHLRATGGPSDASFVGVGIPIFKGDQRFSFVAYNTGPTALLFSKQAAGPVIRIGEHNVSGGVDDGGGLGCGGNVYLQNIGVSGYECGLHIINSAWVRLRNVGVKAAVHTGGDSNAAMVRERASILTRSQCRGPTFTKPSSRRY
jgi:hypothetical protein